MALGGVIGRVVRGVVGGGIETVGSPVEDPGLGDSIVGEEIDHDGVVIRGGGRGGRSRAGTDNTGDTQSRSNNRTGSNILNLH